MQTLQWQSRIRELFSVRDTFSTANAALSVCERAFQFARQREKWNRRFATILGILPTAVHTHFKPEPHRAQDAHFPLFYDGKNEI